MSSPQRSSNPKPPPLSRWKGRLRIFNKPAFWGSTALLLLIGLLIADYSRVQISQADIEEQLELAQDQDEQTDSDRSASPSSPANGDGTQSATLDGIPLPDDPELREWAIREANDLNPDSESGDLSASSDTNRQNSTVSEDAQVETFELDEPARLITNTDEQSTSEADDGSVDVNTRRNRRNRQGNRQDNRAESLFADYTKSADDVLSLMGLNAPRSQRNQGNQGNGGSAGALKASAPDGNVLNLFADTSSNPLPPSALAQALQNLAIDSEIAIATTPLGNEAIADLSSNPTPLDTAILPGQSTNQPLEGIPIFQQPLIQTAPPPGTTGYIAPPPLPTVASPGAAIAPPPSLTVTPTIGTQPIGALGSTVPSTTVVPQPTVTLPQSSVPQALPSPVFVPPPPVEHTPYAGGGRNGQINTFSNP